MNETRNPGRGPATPYPAHMCPVNGCRQRVRADRLACRPHWYQIPRPLRDAVWVSWRGGDGAGTPAHLAAISAAIATVNARQEADR